ncbi:MAG: hypothetical protein ACRC46_12090 [Thermoguttaceae bacterium]
MQRDNSSAFAWNYTPRGIARQTAAGGACHGGRKTRRFVVVDTMDTMDGMDTIDKYQGQRPLRLSSAI